MLRPLDLAICCPHNPLGPGPCYFSLIFLDFFFTTPFSTHPGQAEAHTRSLSTFTLSTKHRATLFADSRSLQPTPTLFSHLRHLSESILYIDAMKSALVLAALGAFCGAASAHAGHNHEMLHKMMKKARDVSPSDTADNLNCGCVTSVSTWYGEATCKSGCACIIICKC